MSVLHFTEHSLKSTIITTAKSHLGFGFVATLVRFQTQVYIRLISMMDISIFDNHVPIKFGFIRSLLNICTLLSIFWHWHIRLSADKKDLGTRKIISVYVQL